MSLVINHNMMAANVARNLNSHYANLAKSTQRLSTGMRVNSAADDAAGLAIRELQRADIAALQQGARNANDAISMIQVADGSLSIIDEKLIRMKELAEQAATGTYDSTQRLMIESEYQAMASEITRIANATDFNGIHLLNGNLSSGYHDGSGMTSTGKLKIHFGTGNDSAEDYYYITIGACTAQAFSLGNAATASDATNRIAEALKDNFLTSVYEQFKLKNLTQDGLSKALTDNIVNKFKSALDNVSLINDSNAFKDMRDQWISAKGEFEDAAKKIDYNLPNNIATMDATEYNKLDEHEKEKIRYAFMHAALYNYANKSANSFELPSAGEVQVSSAFSDATTDDKNLLKSLFKDALKKTATEAMDRYQYGGQSITTQEDAQIALDAINKAIVEKDKIRAHLGATQNRLENTITNLNTQAENLQAAESRISDVDVATEMTEFTRQQILSQSAVAMLAQANSLPQMAMQLIGG